jgi:glucosylceramidase
MRNQIIALLLLISHYTFAQQVEWVSTTERNPWVKEKNLSITKTHVSNQNILEVFPNKNLQKMIGFGGCFNELGWEALKLVSQEKQEKIFEQLFSPAGANFQFNRIPIGASDYSLDYYSLDEKKNDFEMKNFSIARDKKCLISYIKKAKNYNPEMHFFASPWCPPSWMKTNENYACKSSSKYNTLTPELETVTGTTSFKMLKGYLEAYALYFSKFLDAYKKEGITIGDLQVQNEVIAEQIFPSCIWEPQDLALFIGDYLGPLFEKENRNVNIWFGTLNVGDFKYLQTAMSNQKAAGYIKGFGFQWAGKEMIADAHQAYPQKHIMQTENECGNGENNWKSAEHTWFLIKHYINRGAEAYIYWNFILEIPGVSHWGWTQNSMVTISKTTGEVVFTPEFYVMKHLSHFVQPGASLLSVSDSSDMLAFKNPDGKIIIVLANQSSAEKTQILKIDEKYVDVTIKPNSFNTFVL